MPNYIFILGNNPKLSKAEIESFVTDCEIIDQTDQYLVVNSPILDCQQVLDILGGSIKLGQVIDKPLTAENLAQHVQQSQPEGKVKFGLSYYNRKPDRKLGMEVKRMLKQAGINSRLVTAQEPALSSVIVKKNKCVDFLILPKIWGVTCAVQDFKTYSQLDYGRPRADAKSGMLPPKLAKIMLNLAQLEHTASVLDPFCGSGTILMQAAALGYTNLLGSDVSDRAVADTQQNLSWLRDKFKWQFKSQIFQSDVQDLVRHLKSVDGIVTEPYLGKPLTGKESNLEIEKNIQQVKAVYLQAFKSFKSVLRSHGKLVMVMPQWHISDQVLGLNLDSQIAEMGFKLAKTDNLIYKRDKQHVWRRIRVYVAE